MGDMEYSAQVNKLVISLNILVYTNNNISNCCDILIIGWFILLIVLDIVTKRNLSMVIAINLDYSYNIWWYDCD